MTKRLREFWKRQTSRERPLVRVRESAPVECALAHPNAYSIGMSNLGLHAIYRMLNEDPRSRCERFFLPPKDIESIHIRSRIPLVTCESLKPVNTFDVVAFSTSFEFDYVWIIRMLKLAQIPLYSKDRTEYDPIVLMGGPCSWMNPLPMAHFIDVFAMGDGEKLVPILLDIFTKYQTRTERLEALARSPFFYVPGVHGFDGKVFQTGQKRPVFISAREKRRPATSAILTPDTVFSNMYLIEMMKGCPHWCRFCWIGYNHPLLSFTDSEVFFDIVDTEVPHDISLGLVGSSPADHPSIEKILKGLLTRHKKFSFSSLRIDSLNMERLKALRMAGKKSFTIAPETGSDELRHKVVRKPLTNDDLIHVTQTAVRLGFRSVKMYIIIGFPQESWDHLKESVETFRILSQVASQSKSFVVKLSINCLIPKPNTPFQYAPVEDEHSLNEKIRFLKSSLKKLPNIRATFMNPLYAYYQTVLSLGGAELHSFLLEVEKNDGHWRSVFRGHFSDFRSLLFDSKARDAISSHTVPVGYRSDFLRKEYEKVVMPEERNHDKRFS